MKFTASVFTFLGFILAGSIQANAASYDCSWTIQQSCGAKREQWVCCSYSSGWAGSGGVIEARAVSEAKSRSDVTNLTEGMNRYASTARPEGYCQGSSFISQSIDFAIIWPMPHTSRACN